MTLSASHPTIDGALAIFLSVVVMGSAMKAQISVWRIVLMMLVGQFAALHSLGSVYGWGVENPSDGVILLKTKETFKLSELQQLELELGQASDTYQCSRILVDAATGSSLFAIRSDWEPSTLRAKFSAIRRCDWMGMVLVQARNAPELLKNIQNSDLSFLSSDWSMDYIRMHDSQVPKNATMNLGYSMKNLLCCVSYCLPSKPCLDARKATCQLVVVETIDRGIFLLDVVKEKNALESRKSPVVELSQFWKKRPFPYSSSINFDLALIVVDALWQQLPERTQNQVHFWDATCGSGTFLAIALDHPGSIVTGTDINPQCIKGSRRNLDFCRVSTSDERVRLSACDVTSVDRVSEIFGDPFLSHGRSPDIVVANLPWGINSLEYVGEADRILAGIRSTLRPGTPCGFVAKDGVISAHSCAQFGYSVLRQAHVPPKGFELPVGKKQGEATSPRMASRNYRNDCVVTFCTTI